MEPLKELKLRQRNFVRERGWEQFRSPKNLAMALSVEVSEILELLQWSTELESGSLSHEDMSAIRDEIGDVLNYLVLLSDRLDIEPVEAALQKIEKNRKKYPVGIKQSNGQNERVDNSGSCKLAD